MGTNKTMTLKQVYENLRTAETASNGPTLWPGDCGDMADAIDSYLSGETLPLAIATFIPSGRMDDLDHEENGFVRGWNACRAAMINLNKTDERKEL